MRIWTAIASTLSLVATASAQPNRAASESSEIDPDPLYRVEVILFAFDEGNRGEEDFFHGIDDPRFGPLPKLLRLPNIELESVFNLRSSTDAVNLAPRLEAETQAPPEQSIATIPVLEDRLELIEPNFEPGRFSSTSAVTLPAGFRKLRREELELGAAAARMNRRPYTLLGYAGWEQAGVDTDRSVQVDLKHTGITNPTGTIEVYLRRFLHVLVDLEFFDGDGTLWTAPAGFGLTPFSYAQSYELIDETNAIRSGELHFIDHPLFGMLIRITPAPEPEDEPGTENTDGPAG